MNAFVVLGMVLNSMKNAKRIWIVAVYSDEEHAIKRIENEQDNRERDVGIRQYTRYAYEQIEMDVDAPTDNENEVRRWGGPNERYGDIDWD